MSISLSRGTTEDAGKLAELHAQCFTPAWDAKAFRHLLEQTTSVVFLGHLAGKQAADAFIVVQVAADEAEILTLGTIPTARRKKLAEALATQAAAEAFRLGAHAIFLEVAEGNTAARRLYERLGLSEIGRRRNYYVLPGGPAEDAVLLRAELPLKSGV